MRGVEKDTYRREGRPTGRVSGPGGPGTGVRTDGRGVLTPAGDKAVLTSALLRSLAPCLWRTLPWRALGAAGGTGLLLAAVVRWKEWAPGDGSTLGIVRLIALSGALGLAFLLDDPARHTTATTPLGRPLRAGLRLALVAPLTALWWTAALLLIPGPIRPPLGTATLEAAAVAASAVALATLTVRFTDVAEAGRATAVRLGVVTAVALLVPQRWGLSAVPGEPWWEATQVRWAVLLGVALTATALCTPEPLRRRPVRFGT
ncbi:ABC transporter [Streptomyces sp. NPDC017936]|uniref:ABC transporter n=1 Tax=Streptomyces sp. NPDC017936 TaxID=3365016 RepID=UPI00378C3BD6